MSTRIKRILLGLGVALVIYFGGYFGSVRTSFFEDKASVVPSPFYRPFDGSFVRVVFAPAHLIDAAYLRRAHWEPRNRT